jgi:hypothetical protein
LVYLIRNCIGEMTLVHLAQPLPILFAYIVALVVWWVAHNLPYLKFV